MSPRLTNLALLGLLLLALITGTLAFAIGTSPVRWVVVVHGAVGIGIVALIPWKQAIVRRGFGRRRPRGRVAAVLLIVMVVVALAAGFAHSAGLVAVPGGVTTMQIHVGAALLAIAPATWHLATRWIQPHRADLSRRTLLRTAGLAAVAGAGWGLLEVSHRLLRLPGADRRGTGSHERGTDRPAAMPVTQWLFDDVPTVDPGTWRLQVRSADGHHRLLDLGALRQLPARTDRVLLDCTGGWYATQEWTGVPLTEMPGIAGSWREGAGRVLVRSVTGYWRAFPLRDIDSLLLAYEVAGEPLTRGHGFPVRLVASGRRGFWWVKWVEEVVVDDLPWWRQPPFPLQ